MKGVDSVGLLKAHRQLYSSLVKFHAYPEDSERNQTCLKGRYCSQPEVVLGRSLEHLRRLETLAAIGGGELGSVNLSQVCFQSTSGSNGSP